MSWLAKRLSLGKPEGFETFADAKERRDQKIRILSQGDKDQQRLATKLERCRKGCRCESAACDVCLRLYQLRLFRQTGPVLAARPPWTRASVVSAGFLLRLGELVNVELKALGEMIDTRLERSSLRQRIVRRQTTTDPEPKVRQAKTLAARVGNIDNWPSQKK